MTNQMMAQSLNHAQPEFKIVKQKKWVEVEG